MGQGDIRVVYVDLTGAPMFEAILPWVPRTGDSVELLDIKVNGSVEHVTWQVSEHNLNSRAVVHVKPRV